ncbi:DUF4347 domain-containing protein, partial [Asticcacaulis sp.]|uniref:DUF4347 domain-containing protein n=1 Tax=Asticcacaulis sp. TaxID=1872648 RepID=UPI0026294DBD
MGKRMNKRGGSLTSTIALEPRMMFDAAAVATASETVHQIDGQVAGNSPDADVSSLLSALANVPAAADHKVVVVVDTSVKDYQSLVDGLAPGAELILINGASSGFDQLASALAGRTDIDALHIISHGSQGSVTLGSDTLSTANLASHDADLAIIAGAMAEDGDILLYGCLVGNGEGQDFVEALAVKTGADIAASDDLTGSAALGGDWDLEVRSGDIDATAVISAETLAGYENLLALPNGSQVLSSIFTVTGGSRQVISFGGTDFDTYPQWSDTGGYFTLTGGGNGSVRNIGLAGPSQSYEPWVGLNATGNAYFKVVANTSKLSTFQLNSLNMYLKNAYSFTGVQITGYRASGGTVTNTAVNINTTGVKALTVSSFSGIDLTGFRIDFASTSHSLWYLYFQSFGVTGSAAPSLPEIAVTGNSTNITDGDTTPSTTDHTDFGSTAVAGGTVERTYTINNTGPGALNISSITLSNTTDFSFVGTNPTSIAAGQSATVTVRFDPASAGSKTSTLTINSNDSDEAAFDFRLTGTGVAGPSITSATYNASTNVLTVTGDSLTNGGAIDETKLTLTGQGGSTYTLTETGAITASSATSFSITLNATDQINVEGLLNNNGTTSATGSTTYNLAAAADWHGTGNADLTGNGVTVSNVQTPTITSATYNASTGVLTVTGTNLVRQSGS